MKKALFFLLLAGTLLVGCHKAQPNPDEPDNATIVSGNYELIRARSDDRDILDHYKAWIRVSKIDANHAKAGFSFSPPVSPFTESWLLKKIAKDTIELRESNGLYKFYQSGQIDVVLGDGLLYLRFKKVE